MPPAITIHHHHHNANDTTTTISDSSDADLNQAHGRTVHHGQHGGASTTGGAAAAAGPRLHLLKVPPIHGMSYLSPFSFGGASRSSDRNISEGNLSSSGYSSMASPGPSRCGSNNPLLPGEMGGGAGGGSGSGAGSGDAGGIGGTADAAGTSSGRLSAGSPSAAGAQKASSPAAGRSTAVLGAVGGHLMMHLGPGGKLQQLAAARRARLRSDSETLSDDLVLESNDEGIEMDQGGSGGAEETPENVDTLLGLVVVVVDGSGCAGDALAGQVETSSAAPQTVAPVPAAVVATSTAAAAQSKESAAMSAAELPSAVFAVPTITLEPCEADEEQMGVQQQQRPTDESAAVVVSPVSSRSESPLR